jgi:hypothetical protein
MSPIPKMFVKQCGGVAISGKKLRDHGGFEPGAPLSLMNGTNMNTPEKQNKNQTLERKNRCKLNNQ